MHAVSLCFDKAEVNEASLTYDGDDYNVNFNCDIDEFGTGYLLSSSSEGVDVNLVIRDFYSNLILNIESNLVDLMKKEETGEEYWKEYRMYSHEYSYLNNIASFMMLKDILSKFRQ